MSVEVLDEDFSENFDRADLLPGHKCVYFIRHGESEANLARTADALDSARNIRYRDTHLSEKGVRQAKNLQKQAERLDIDLLVSSPLRRAIQTACHVFSHTAIDNSNIDDGDVGFGNKENNIPFICEPAVMEFFPSLIENKGHTKHELENDPSLTSFERFKDCDLGALQDNDYWYTDNVNEYERLATFSKKLLTKWKGSIIAVVSHFGFIQFLIKSWGFGSVSPNNCCLLRTIWSIGPPVSLNISPSHKGMKRKYSIFLRPSGNGHNNGLLIESLNLMKEMMNHDKYKLSSTLGFGLNFHIQLTSFFHLDDINSLTILIDTMRLFIAQSVDKNAMECKPCITTDRIKTKSIKVVDGEPIVLKQISCSHIYFKFQFVSDMITDIFSVLAGYFDGVGSSSSSSSSDNIDELEGDMLVIRNQMKKIIEMQNLTIELINLKGTNLGGDSVWPLLDTKPILLSAFDNGVYYAWDYLFKQLHWSLEIVGCEFDNGQLLPYTLQEIPGGSFPLFENV